jgi:hypothetical protein
LGGKWLESICLSVDVTRNVGIDPGGRLPTRCATVSDFETAMSSKVSALKGFDAKAVSKTHTRRFYMRHGQINIRSQPSARMDLDLVLQFLSGSSKLRLGGKVEFNRV